MRIFINKFLFIFLFISFHNSCAHKPTTKYREFYQFKFDRELLCKIERVSFDRREAGLPAFTGSILDDRPRRDIAQLKSEDKKVKSFEKVNLSPSDYYFGSMTIVLFNGSDLSDYDENIRNSPNIVANSIFLDSRRKEIRLVFEDVYDEYLADWPQRREKVDRFIKKVCGI